MTLRIIDDEKMPFVNGFDMKNGDENYIMGIKTMHEWIMWQPVLSEPNPDLDIEKVVRCKDCVYGKKLDNGFIDCTEVEKAVYLVGDYDYCSRGERRNEE